MHTNLAQNICHWLQHLHEVIDRKVALLQHEADAGENVIWLPDNA